MALFWEILVWIILNQDTVEKGCKNAFQRSEKSSVLPAAVCPASWRQGSAQTRTVCWRARLDLCSALARAPGHQSRCCQSAAGNLLATLTRLTAVLHHHFENCKPVLVRVHTFCRPVKKGFVLWLCVSKTCWNNCATWHMHSTVHEVRPHTKLAISVFKSENFRDIPGGPVVKNPPCNAGGLRFNRWSEN